MVVVTDTSPINYLILIRYVDVLPVLHGDVVIPQAVARELLRNPRTPELVRQWIAAPPAWCSIQRPQGLAYPALADLGDGAREAILLCQELGTDALLTDDTEAYDAARAKGIAVIRTLAHLERAALQGLLDLPTAITRLQETTFYAPAHVINAMLTRYAAQHSPTPPEP
jgi:predicted nucleic acid-binding protein